jgi:hypothetical protein
VGSRHKVMLCRVEMQGMNTARRGPEGVLQQQQTPGHVVMSQPDMLRHRVSCWASAANQGVDESEAEGEQE